MSSKAKDKRKHQFVARWIECSCGQMVPPDKFEKHLLEGLEAELLDNLKVELSKIAHKPKLTERT